MHRCLAFDGDGRARAVDTPEQAREASSVWLDLDSPDEGELQQWLEPLVQLHPLAAGRLVHGGRPRLQVFDESVEMCFPLPEGSERLTVLLTAGRAVTVHRGRAPAVDLAWRPFSEGGERAGGADLAIYHVLDHLLTSYERLVAEVVTAAERINLTLPRLRRLRALQRIVTVQRRTFELHRLVGPAVDLFGLLDAGGFPFVEERRRPYFQDLHARARSVAAELTSTRDMLTQDVESVTAVQSQRVNNTMKVLTLISVIFLPATLIASIYGMNFKIPEYHWGLGYAWAIALMAVVTASLLLYLRSRGWLD